MQGGTKDIPAAAGFVLSFYINGTRKEIKLKRICVFCGSSPGTNSKYAKFARKLGETLTEGDITLI
jgi:predicted Rossmann-fold nucleotide-binding protein